MDVDLLKKLGKNRKNYEYLNKKYLQEKWLSGLKHWFAKSTYNFVVSWVRIPSFPLILHLIFYVFFNFVY